MRRWREKLEKDGYAGLADRRKGKRAPSAFRWRRSRRCWDSTKETYYDLNIRHFHEKLQDQHGMELSLHLGPESAARSRPGGQAAQSGGRHRRRRPRRPMPGMLLHIDGSKHRWLNDDRWYDLIVILDDATQ